MGTVGQTICVKTLQLQLAVTVGWASGSKYMKCSEIKLGFHIFSACGITVTEVFENYSGGIMESPVDSDADIDHEISIVGYGQDPKTDVEYWVGRNSWGSYWGEYGYFRVAINSLNIEKQCYWALPAA